MAELVTTITPLLLRTTAPTIFKEAVDFIKHKYSEHKALKQLSEKNDDLVNSLSKIMMVKTLASGADQPINLFKFFQQPKLSYLKDNEEFYIKHIDELSNYIEIDNYNNLIFQGTVGQGKSIFLRSLAIQDLIENKRIPIFLELKNISKNKDLMTLIKEYLQVWIGKDEDVFQLVLKSGKISIFLDAFDEINQELFDLTYADIDLLIKSYPNLKVIVTSRPDTSIIQNANFYVISLCPYTLHEQKGLIQKVVEDIEIQQTLVSSIEASSFEVQEVLETPLMVILYIKQYQVGFSVPKHVTDFYKNIFEVVTRIHDRSKGIEKRQPFSNLNLEQLERVFERLCFESFLLGETVFERTLFINILRKSLEKNKISIDLDFNLIIDDFTRFACLILKDGTKFTFIHKSIQEYYVAKFISDLPEALAKNVIRQKFILSDYYINNIIHFLEISKPYFYKKYYLVEGIHTFQEDFKLEFINNQQDFMMFLNTFYISEYEILNNTDRININLAFNYGSSHVFHTYFFSFIRKIINILLEKNIITEGGFLGLIDMKYDSKEFDDSKKLIKELEKFDGLVLYSSINTIWAEICLEVEKLKEDVRQHESSVLDDELDLADI